VPRINQAATIRRVAYLLGPVAPHGNRPQTFVQKNQQWPLLQLRRKQLIFNLDLPAHAVDLHNSRADACLVHVSSSRCASVLWSVTRGTLVSLFERLLGRRCEAHGGSKSLKRVGALRTAAVVCRHARGACIPLVAELV